MKTRVKEEQFKQVEDAELIGIKWKTGEKGLLLETKEGVICLNNNEMNNRKCLTALTKPEYLAKVSVKIAQEKVFVFENTRSLLKWFAKK